MRSAVALAALSVGCLSVPSKVATQCETSADCGGNGEVCVENTCFGDPPSGTFAAAISPPADRKDLVSEELASVLVPADGNLGDLLLEAPVTFSGRVEAACEAPTDCTTRPSLDADVIITRPSRIPGQPLFTAAATSVGGAADGMSFQVALPPTDANDAPYTITVVPSGNGAMPDTNILAAQQVPPRRLSAMLNGSTSSMVVELGGSALPVLDGMLTDAGVSGLPNYRVVARGRWVATDPVTEVSTVDYTTTDGNYKLTLADGLVGTVEIVATPFAGPAPTLHLANISATASSTHNLTAPAGLGNPTPLVVHLQGYDGSGKLTAVSGARVIVSASASLVPHLEIVTTLSDEGTTDSSGAVTLHLLDGATLASSYQMSIIPPASSGLGAIYAQAVTLGMEQDLTLEARVALRGILVDSSGNPLNDVSVTSNPSASFLASLDPASAAFLAAIPAATTVTPETGDFVLWVDPIINQVWGHYDLVFEPQDGKAPDWTLPGVEIPRIASQTTVSIPDVTIPDPAFVRARLADPSGMSLEMADLQLFLVTGTDSQLAGRGTSMSYEGNDVGEVRLSLARP